MRTTLLRFAAVLGLASALLLLAPPLHPLAYIAPPLAALAFMK